MKEHNKLASFCRFQICRVKGNNLAGVASHLVISHIAKKL